MEAKAFLVRECKNCGGWCCKSLNSAGTDLSYWRKLTPDAAVLLNPWIPKRIDISTLNLATCTLLSAEGLCSAYERRHEACRTYPNVDYFLMEYLDGSAAFYVPWCTYREVVLTLLGIPCEFYDSGEECRRKYLELIKEDPSFAEQFYGAEVLKEQSHQL